MYFVNPSLVFYLINKIVDLSKFLPFLTHPLSLDDLNETFYRVVKAQIQGRSLAFRIDHNNIIEYQWAYALKWKEGIKSDANAANHYFGEK